MDNMSNLMKDPKALYAELLGLARVIEQTRTDIASIRAEEIKSKHIPSATDELDAITAATEEATGSIMDSCEKIQTLVTGHETLGAPVGDEVTKIFEACTFQDITGQRISKVIKALKSIDEKVAALLKTLSTGDLAKDVAIPPSDEPTGEAALLNGPQLKGQGVSQDDIDRLMKG
jgi:chemotaxis protein CheZ